MDGTEGILVNGDSLKIFPDHLECGKVYEFEYLGYQMMVKKRADDSIDIFEVGEK